MEPDESVRIAKTLLTLNSAYKEAIDEKIASLRHKLEQNQQQQVELAKQIAEAAAVAHDKTKSPRQDYIIKHHELELFKIKSSYFRDRFQSEPPECPDAQKKHKLNFYEFTSQVKIEWSLSFRQRLKQSVLEDSMRILKSPLSSKVAFLEEKLAKVVATPGLKASQLKAIKAQLKETQKSLKTLDAYTDEQIFVKADINQIDWLKIAKIDLNGNWSSTECRLVWLNVCNPTINQGKWTQAEFKQLVELARKHNEHNWDQIAAELNTNRSAYLCLKRYHEKTVASYTKRDWSDQETQELCKNSDRYRIGQYIPYNYLCYLNGTRDRNSVYSWHVKCDPHMNHGKWTPVEEQAFDEALLFYNTVYNWQEISDHVMTRTSLQCRERYELKYHNPEKYINWTIEDDKRLLESFKRYDGQWFKMAAFDFPDRNDNACLFRFKRLMNWRKQNVWFQNQQDEIREFIMLLSKPCKKQDMHPEVYTDCGELVPRPPKFSQYLSGLIGKIYEKKSLIEEFIQKKRQGQLSLVLISRIGIYTSALNMIINRYKRSFQLAHPSVIIKKNRKKNTINQKVREKVKKIKDEFPTSATNGNKLIKTIKQSIRSRATATVMPDDSDTTAATTIFKANSINKLLNIKTENVELVSKAPKKKHIKDLIDLTDFGVKKEQDVPLCSTLIEQTLQPQEPMNKLEMNAVVRLNKLKISELTGLVSSRDPEIVVTLPKKRGRKRKSEIIEPVLSEPLAKKARKKPVKAKVIKPIKVDECPTELKALKEVKLNQFNQSVKKELELSPLIVKFGSIPDGQKIPCIAEQSSLFKFMYMLKKEKTNAKYFHKYKILKLTSGQYVALKAFNSEITDEYLNATRLNAINDILKQVVIKANPT